ncbi:hypothetical protein AMJ57_02785 [Parcubacteria bacterium SG8_24]|nr:MAG: hypothetical protein AMJ57_02785 [Parcubacteria bacterium SG8_24]
MKDKSKLFKAYDIRGLAPQEIDEDLAYRVGQALVRFTEAKTVVVGQDMRETTPALFDAFARGAMSQGADVIDIGLVTTPMLYYAVGEYELHDAGAMITASHNPKEYNGIKMCYGDVRPIGGNSGMWDIRDLALAGPYPGEPEGTLVTTDIKDAYLDKLLSEVDLKSIKPFKIVVDTGNGMEGVIIEDILKALPQCEVHPLFLELDGSFPNHEANPLKDETLIALKEKMMEVGADFGVAFDGDGDRIGLVDETGETVRGDMLTGLLAPLLLKKSPGGKVLYDVRMSLSIPEEIERAGGVPVMCPVGHGLIKPMMREEGAVFAGELSNHYYFRDFYGAESSDLVMLLVLDLMSRTGKSLSELIAPLKRYQHSGEINSEVEDKEAVLRELDRRYAAQAGQVTRIDGVRMDFHDPDDPEGDWWFSVRVSNTEPLMRLNLEAKRREKMEEKREELLKVIRG